MGIPGVGSNRQIMVEEIDGVKDVRVQDIAQDHPLRQLYGLPADKSVLVQQEEDRP